MPWVSLSPSLSGHNWRVDIEVFLDPDFAPDINLDVQLSRREAKETPQHAAGSRKSSKKGESESSEEED